MMQKMSSNIEHIGQGRPSNNSENDSENREIHEIARKMSLLGLFSTASNSGYGRTIYGSNNLNSIGKVSPDLHVRHELLNRIHAFIPPGVLIYLCSLLISLSKSVSEIVWKIDSITAKTEMISGKYPDEKIANGLICRTL
ncbi:hypothetical protein RCL_jg18431.t1 [Rhizophagus clarus]|uniref:Uncharacterized protein n=1 Tax=Rhizophagus clarus TaxID=94130 RepID=A0A8H3QNI9_9GLOM|nr:hypothetical protein RCL_jg18431.t1 [Rhizophagus clarus]